MKNISLNIKGFTAIELMVSATILIVMFSFVLANFRAGRYSGEIDVVPKQVTDGISTVRGMALGGQLIEHPVSGDKVFPTGGFGIYFNKTIVPSKFTMFADFNGDGVYDDGQGSGSGGPDETIPNGAVNFSNVRLIDLCALKDGQFEITALPCDTALWDNIGDQVNIIFPSPQVFRANVGSDPADVLTNNFIGGVFEHSETGQQAYFYFSAVSGLVTGENL